MTQKRKYNVSVDPVASDKMFSHVRFLAQVSVPAAKRLYDALNEAIDTLEDSPKSCPRYIPQEPVEAELRYKLCGNRYRVVFEIIGKAVFVYDIQDCRQDMDKNLV